VPGGGGGGGGGFSLPRDLQAFSGELVLFAPLLGRETVLRALLCKTQIEILE
jgi:hypothetical protein